MGRALLEGLASLQDTESPYPESYGSISGSHPIWGGYGPFNYLNWPPKFFIDALLLELFNLDAAAPDHSKKRKATADCA